MERVSDGYDDLKYLLSKARFRLSGSPDDLIAPHAPHLDIHFGGPSSFEIPTEKFPDRLIDKLGVCLCLVSLRYLGTYLSPWMLLMMDICT